jgi:hypothetical protein
MTARQVRVSSEGFPFVLVEDPDHAGNRLWVGLTHEPDEPTGIAVIAAVEAYFEADGDVLTPAVLLTEDDAEELARQVWARDMVNGSPASQRLYVGDARDVVRRLIAAREVSG